VSAGPLSSVMPPPDAASPTCESGSERGSAIIEFVFVGLVVLVPLVYLLTAVAVVHSSRLAVGDAARDVGRAIATSPTPDQMSSRAQAALAIALGSHQLSPDQVELAIVAAKAPCTAAPTLPASTPGSEFTVCVTHRVRLPGVPRVWAGRAVTTTGRFTVHLDDFRVGSG
jgi:Flp pilus assembly protein TadG